MSTTGIEIENIAKSTAKKSSITIGAHRKLTLADVKKLADTCEVRLNPEVIPQIENTYRFLKSCVDNRTPIYGVNTHFGDQVHFLDTHLKNTESTSYEACITSRQMNLIRSHRCALGDIVPLEIVRVAMMLRAHCLAQGYSGVTLAAIHALLNYVNAGITPLVPKYGSIGASGDLIPLACIAAAIIGEEVNVMYQNEIMPASHAMQIAKLTPLKPQLRDGLALINGTSFMTAISSLALYQLKRLFKQMLCAIGMALEAMQVITSGYHPLVHRLKLQSGENSVNDFLLEFWKGSQLLFDLDELRLATLTEEKHTTRSVQDYYSLRSVAQGFGPFQENLVRATDWIENEMNAVSDNPIIDTNENKIYHCANFMGYYVTNACDILKMDIAQASTWIHALLANLVHPRKNHDLPANLVSDPGRHNGFRPIQLLAASLAVQNRKLAQSHQAHMLPTEGDNQDVNSLGTHAALDLREATDNLERLTAILFLASTQALEFRGQEKAGKKSRIIHKIIRRHSATVAVCRPLSEEIHAIITLLKEEKIGFVST